MSQPQETNPAASSFAAHVREFHRSLPDEEKQMLEQVFALAEAASMAFSGEGDDVKGYAVDAFIWFNTADKWKLADKMSPGLLTFFSQGAKKV